MAAWYRMKTIYRAWGKKSRNEKEPLISRDLAGIVPAKYSKQKELITH
jgi:hypothetical protein